MEEERILHGNRKQDTHFFLQQRDLHFRII